MSEVIVRMEMPKGCDECIFCFGHCILDEKDAKNGYVHFNEVVIADYKGKYAVRKDRPDWCPIVCALPENHGRLVDADDLESRCRPVKNFEYGEMLVLGRGPLMCSKTIVPATEGEK